MPGLIRDIALAGDVAYVATGRTCVGLDVAATPGKPLVAYSLADPAAPAFLWSRSDLDPYRVASADGVAYVGSRGEASVAVVRLDDPFGAVTTVEAAGPSVAVVLGGDRLYAYGGFTDVSVFSVSTPTAPVLLGAVAPVSGAGYRVRDGALYAAGAGGVAVFDARPAPGAAVPLATYAGQAGTLFDIAATATDVFLAEGSSGVERLAAQISVAGDAAAPGDDGRLLVVPNPTAGPATVAFTLAEASDVRVKIVDVLGRRVRVLASGPAAAGEQRVVWDGRGDAVHSVAAGVYVVRVSAGGTVRTQPVTVVR